MPSFFPGLFNVPGLPFGPVSCWSYLPRPGWRQFQVSASFWYAKLNSTTVLWGTNGAGAPGTELDLHRDLELDKRRYHREFEGRFQIRPNWGIRYSFMPIQYQQTANVRTPGGFFFGSAFYPQGAQMYAKWDRFIHRWDLVYDWYSQPHAVSSIFAGYTMYDDKLTVSTGPGISRTRSRHLHLAFAGAGMDKIVRSLGGGGTASLHCKASLQFLDGYFGWDGKATGRISVPLNCGRFGYLEAGWRWMVLRRELPTDIDNTSMDGLTGSVGIIF